MSKSFSVRSNRQQHHLGTLYPLIQVLIGYRAIYIGVSFVVASIST
jgi:hypothetical protein